MTDLATLISPADSAVKQETRERAAYILRFQGHLDRYFADRIDVAGKRVFVLGSGWGAEALWALKRGAREVVGVDPRAERGPFDLAMETQGLSHLAERAIFHAGTVLDVPDVGAFDALMSNNVLEHVFGLSANLAALTPLMSSPGARFVVFTDPLFLSAHGHHLPIGAWEHLMMSQQAIKERVGRRQYAEYRDGLNGMTITDFLNAVREAGMIITEMTIRPDPNMSMIEAALPLLPSGIKPMDLCLSGISCTLAFPQNLA